MSGTPIGGQASDTSTIQRIEEILNHYPWMTYYPEKLGVVDEFLAHPLKLSRTTSPQADSSTRED